MQGFPCNPGGTPRTICRMANPPGKTRERILDAAMDLFLENGIGGTTVSDIERAVGLAVGTGSFYRHFPSKDAVVVPALERRLAQVFEHVVARRTETAEIDDPGQRDRAQLRRLLDDMREIQPLGTLLMLERNQYPELAAVFVEGLRMDTWQIDLEVNPQRAIVMAALAGFHQLSLFEGSPYRGVDTDEFLDTLAAMVSPLGANVDV